MTGTSLIFFGWEGEISEQQEFGPILVSFSAYISLRISFFLDCPVQDLGGRGDLLRRTNGLP